MTTPKTRQLHILQEFASTATYRIQLPTSQPRCSPNIAHIYSITPHPHRPYPLPLSSPLPFPCRSSPRRNPHAPARIHTPTHTHRRPPSQTTYCPPPPPTNSPLPPPTPVALHISPNNKPFSKASPVMMYRLQSPAHTLMNHVAFKLLRPGQHIMPWPGHRQFKNITWF